jgi:hypothetical protein
MRSFGPDVRTALLTADKPGNTIKAEAFQDHLVLDSAGAKASSFSPEEKSRLIELIDLYVGNMHPHHRAHAERKSLRQGSAPTASPCQHDGEY